MINLVMNGIEAMQPVTDRPRELVIRSRQNETRQVFVSVTDCGVGISAENADRLFNAFFTMPVYFCSTALIAMLASLVRAGCQVSKPPLSPLPPHAGPP
jgi:hypothetical protein